jgi:hypothetical protein
MASATSMQTSPAQDAIDFEVVVFQRVGDLVEVTIRGMTRMRDCDIVVSDDPFVTRLTPVGVGPEGPVREYAVRGCVEIVDDVELEVGSGRFSESIIAANLTEDLPVVCTADPAAEGLPVQFLHKRGERYVLTSAADVLADARSWGRTTLVA